MYLCKSMCVLFLKPIADSMMKMEIINIQQ